MDEFSGIDRACLVEELRSGVSSADIEVAAVDSTVFEALALPSARRLRTVCLSLDGTENTAIASQVLRSLWRPQTLELSGVLFWDAQLCDALEFLLAKKCVKKLCFFVDKTWTRELQMLMTDAANKFALERIDLKLSKESINSMPQSFGCDIDISCFREAVGMQLNRTDFRKLFLSDPTCVLAQYLAQDISKCRLKKLAVGKCKDAGVLIRFLKSYKMLESFEITFAPSISEVLCELEGMTQLRSLMISKSRAEINHETEHDVNKLLQILHIRKFDSCMFNSVIAKTIAERRLVTKFCLSRQTLPVANILVVLAAECVQHFELRSVDLEPLNVSGEPESEQPSASSAWELLLRSLPAKLRVFEVVLSGPVLTSVSSRKAYVHLFNHRSLQTFNWFSSRDDPFTADDVQQMIQNLQRNTTLRELFFSIRLEGGDDLGLIDQLVYACKSCVDFYLDGFEQKYLVANSRRRCAIAESRALTLTLLALRRFRATELSRLIKDLVVLIAKALWEGRFT